LFLDDISYIFQTVIKVINPRNHAFLRFIPIATVLTLLLSSTLFAQMPITISEKSYGVLLSSATHGGSFGGYYVSDLGRKLQFSFQGGIMDVRGETEFPIIDPYTGYTYQTQQTNALLLPVFLGIRYHPFMDKLASGFSPYFTLGLGPVMAFDPPDEESLLTDMGNTDITLNLGGLVAFGADIVMPGNSFFSVSFGYNLFELEKAMDGRSNYSGGMLQIMIGKRVRF